MLCLNEAGPFFYFRQITLSGDSRKLSMSRSGGTKQLSVKLANVA
jgi:hypothetical protein